MKILIVHPYIFLGGAEKAIAYLAYHLEQMGNRVAVATLSAEIEGLPPVAEKLNYLLPDERIPLDRRRFVDLKDTTRAFFKELQKLRKLVSEFGGEYDVLNPHVFPAYWATAGKGKVVWTCNEVLGPYDRARDLYSSSKSFRIAFRAIKRLDMFVVSQFVGRIVTNSLMNQRLIMERYRRTSRVAIPGVDYEFFGPDLPDAKETLDLGNKYVLLQVGALTRRKRHDLGIKVLKRIKKYIPNSILVIVGEGPLKFELVKQAKELGLEDDVMIMGRLNEGDLKLTYKASDILLFPVTDQTFGMVPFEALASGVPVIVSTEAGCSSIIERESLGFVVRPNVDELCNAILKARRKPDLVVEMVRRGRRYVRENLTWRRFAKIHLEEFALQVAEGEPGNK